MQSFCILLIVSAVIDNCRGSDNTYAIEMNIPILEEAEPVFSFASYYQDHMVLQGTPNKAHIWGYAPNGTQGSQVDVSVGPDILTVSVQVSQQLLWTAMIGPMSVGGPHTISAKLGTTEIGISDVLFGDIWVCSGQSNMQFTMASVFNATEELEDSINYPDIRVFVVKDNTSTTPLSDLSRAGILLPWSLPSNATLGGNWTSGYFSAVCWLYGKYLYQTLKKPIGLVETSWGGTPVEAWSSPDALHKCGLSPNDSIKATPANEDIDVGSSVDNIDGPQEYTVLWNAMVAPLLNMTIYGTIWYQGENNVRLNRNKYQCTFPAMIDDWRKKFSASSDTDQLFPFGFVQLSTLGPSYNGDTGFDEIRWHQTADYGYVPNHRLRNVFMAVAMDLPDFESPHGPIHPRDKQDVARRLSLGGLAIGYGHSISFEGPYPTKVTITQEEPYNYTQVDTEYTMNLQQKWLDGFETCCAYKSPPECKPGMSWWLPTATISGYDRLNLLQSYAAQCDAENVVGLRYAWRDTPCPFKNCAIYGADNSLPLPPFTYYGKTFHKTLVGKGRYEVLLKQPHEV